MSVSRRRPRGPYDCVLQVWNFYALLFEAAQVPTSCSSSQTLEPRFDGVVSGFSIVMSVIATHVISLLPPTRCAASPSKCTGVTWIGLPARGRTRRPCRDC